MSFEVLKIAFFQFKVFNFLVKSISYIKGIKLPKNTLELLLHRETVCPFKGWSAFRLALSDQILILKNYQKLGISLRKEYISKCES